MCNHLLGMAAGHADFYSHCRVFGRGVFLLSDCWWCLLLVGDPIFERVGTNGFFC